MEFETAVEIAARAHRGQTDKEGVTYLLHPLRVSLVVSARARSVAVLHDVLEDTAVTEDDLRRAGLGDVELEALRLLTKQTDEENDYERFIGRILEAGGAAGELAREVKLADVRDNLGRMPESQEPDWLRRRQQYERALRTLSSRD